jgi:hypothetical protein
VRCADVCFAVGLFLFVIISTPRAASAGVVVDFKCVGLQRRRVWPEFCKQAEPVLVVRPGNWVQL